MLLSFKDSLKFKFLGNIFTDYISSQARPATGLNKIVYLTTTMANLCKFTRTRRIKMCLVFLVLPIALCVVTLSILTFGSMPMIIAPQHSHSSSTTHYLRHFRSIFILDVANHDLALDRQGKPLSISSSDVRTESRASAVNNKLIVWYNMPYWIEKRSYAEVFGHCPVNTCNLSTNYGADRAAGDAVVFHGSLLDIPVPPRAFPDQVYVFHMLEPPPKLWFGKQKNLSWNSAFNWTWGYRHDADIRATYFCLEHSKQLPTISFLKDLVRKKEKAAAWFVSNCHDQAQRLRYVERLKEVLPVDVYGRCGTLNCTTWARECETMLTKYFFYLSFENSFCQDYVTEKFSRAFLKDVYVVPVVRGDLNYSHHFPQGIFINADDFSSPEELGMYLKKLMNDEDAYIDMLWRIAHFVDLDSYKNPYYYSWCQLCDKLHRLQDNAKTYPDVFEWYEDGTCRPPREF
ncbi:alpha-(1,3)-fucosyltransferase C-like isoform X2 [Pomacea canaliculata]|uniref:alpha-(1,3)-fucosyltransferase C-like isoform X2 n=1 Tax=Pomacea canaliculata TaxID=400727 RepID=UPI000D7301D1|nr:alpha-(1,3)-fucosyltransferase C-like isoform X2 [Pomacea canaliculata]